MANSDDLEQMRAKIKDLETKKSKLEDQIENETQKNNILNFMKSEYEKIHEDFLQEEQNNLQEIGDLSLEVKKLRKLVPEKPQKIFDLHDSNLEQGENDLMAEIELMERATFILDQTKQQLDKATKEEEKITPLLEQTESFVFRYENVATSLMKPAKFILSIEELEARLNHLKKRKPQISEEIAAKEEEKNNINIDNSFKTSELNRIHANIDGKNADTSINETTICGLLSELSKCSSELQRTNTKFEDQKTDLINPIEADIQTTREDINKIREDIERLKHEKEDFPNIIKEASSDDRRKVQKKIQLISEITRKINDTKNELIRSMSSSSTVMQLNSEMEKEWKEEQKMEDDANALEKQLMRLQEDLERKKYMRIEIEKIQNTHVPKRENGIKALETVYDVALKENRSLAEKISKVQKEYQNVETKYLNVKKSNKN